MPKSDNISKIYKANDSTTSIKTVIPYKIRDELELKEGMSLKWEISNNEKDKKVVNVSKLDPS